MIGFNWTASRLARLRSAVRAYNATLTRRVRELADMGMGHLASALPERVTVAGIMERVNDVNDFRRIVGYRNDARRGRTSELTRILRSVNPSALDVVSDSLTGAPTTRYAQREEGLNRRAIARAARRAAEQMASTLYEGDVPRDLDAMTPVERATAMADTDMMPPDEGEPDDTLTDVDADTLTRWRQEDAQRKRSQVQPISMFYVYLRTWENPLNKHQLFDGYQRMIDALTWLATKRPDVLNKMFNSGRDEIDPDYITESGGLTNPYIHIPFETRHNRAVRYVVDIAVHAGMDTGVDLNERIILRDPVYFD